MIDPPPALPRKLTMVDGTGARAQLPAEAAWQRRALAEQWWPPEAVVLYQTQAEIETARTVLAQLSTMLSPRTFAAAVHAVDELYDERMGLCDCHWIKFEDVQPAAQGSLW